MELRQYLRIILRSWWFIIPVTLIALTASLVFSYATTPIYRAASSYVAGLAPDVGASSDAIIYGLDTLAGRERIFSTYCGVLNSHNVRQDAYRLMGVSDPAGLGLDDYVVQCNVLPDSNILLLIVEGPAPTLVTRLNEAVGLAGMAQTNRLYRPFPLERLDPVVLEPEPVSPNYTQNAVLGAVLGLVLGITLAFVVEYLRSPLERIEGLTIRDPKLGVYNERYFLRRFEEEIKRARVRNRPISLAFTQLVPDEDFNLLEERVQDALLRQAALFMQDSLREGDIVAYFGQHVFGLLFAETPGDEARSMLVNMHYDIRSRTFRFEDFSASFEAKSGVVESSGGLLGTQAMMDKAAEALRDAELAGENAIQLIRTSPAPFIQGDTTGAATPTLAFDASPLDDTLGTTWSTGNQPPVFDSEPELREDQ
ncbi:MAG: diguanylate cyclase [Anaerolineae bacterium]|nr:diguanylate cyclase [Anaerolineae bacterium]